MRDEQRKIVSNALERLSSELVTSVIKNNNFITLIQDYDDNKIVIIDFTKQMTLDYLKFTKDSQRLYEEFALIPKWHEC